MKNICVLYVEYDNNKYPYSWDILQIYLNKLDPFYNIEVVKIDNKCEECYYPDDWICADEIFSKFKTIKIKGNNHEWEFSGWQKARNYIIRYEYSYDSVLLINDSFITNDYFLNKKLFDKTCIDKCIEDNVVVGKVDNLYNRKENNCKLFTIEYNNDYKDIHSWMRTNIFYMPKSIVNEISFVSIKKEDTSNYISDNINNPFMNKISIDLQRNIGNWIENKWHSKFKVTKETYEFFKMKCLSILNEKLLTYNISQKYNIINVNDIIA